MVDFGRKLRNLRLEAGLTQSELALRLNVTKAVVSYYELHERSPSPEVLIKISTIFHVSTDYLLGLSRRKTLDVSDLSNEELEVLQIIIDSFRKRH